MSYIRGFIWYLVSTMRVLFQQTNVELSSDGAETFEYVDEILK